MTKKVIIIDDSVTALNLLKTAFAKENWEVFGLKDANHTLDIIYDIAPDLIITDAIMPVLGGFRIVRMVREDEKISKIPVIIYSVLDETHAKFYTKEENQEYFLQKNKDINVILNFAKKIVEKHPLNSDYKLEILKAGLKRNNLEKAQKEAQKETLEEEKPVEIIENKPKFEPINQKHLEKIFKEKYNFSFSDEKILSEIFEILYPILKYDLFIVSINSVKTVFFDIRGLILSPVFQNSILKKFDAKNPVLFKKYAPNLKIFISEDEFLQKIQFDFEYKEENIANVIFYSKEKAFWENRQEDFEIIKNLLEKFFIARQLNKKPINPKKDPLKDKYDTNNTPKINKTNTNLYLGIIEILNSSFLEQIFEKDEIDVLNLKISQKIISYLDKDEQVYKNDEDEYNVVFFALDDKQAYKRLNFILNIIKSVSDKIEIAIGASVCSQKGVLDFKKARKQALSALDKVTETNNIIIGD